MYIQFFFCFSHFVQFKFYNYYRNYYLIKYSTNNLMGFVFLAFPPCLIVFHAAAAVFFFVNFLFIFFFLSIYILIRLVLFKHLIGINLFSFIRLRVCVCLECGNFPL